MKKIFAIALALVMVLSMASAFASACTTGFDWSCATTNTYCGKGSIEVVPYVKTNNSCEGYDWQVSECASAVNSENVYYAVKLTVDAYADSEWWAAAKATLSYKGMVKAAPALTLKWDDLKAAIVAEETEDVANTFYYDFTAKAWVLVNDDFEFGDAYVKVEEVEKAANAKVCAKLTSSAAGKAGVVGDYYVTANATSIKVYNEKDGKLLVTYTIKNEKVYKIEYTEECGEATYETIKAFFGLEINTCVTLKAIQANFGWDDKVEDCFAWGSKAASIVDAECVVAIPKTGDASVLAWLF
ncbi:MAG: hypothetical protein IKU32_09165 [Clostridia bacterium]|nr:hypothetical protein [Clostridia bacterium]